MASAKQGLYVVVWEWENKQRRWRPYPPEVTQLLERAHSKNLRSAFLGDSDPALNNYSVNLSTMQQECKVTKEIVNVRRNFYPQSSPAGQGAVWQWSGDKPGDWHMYDMCVQCVIEESWGSGAQTVDLSKAYPMCPYVINFCNLTQMNSRTNFIRSIRRVQQASYPVGKPPQQSRQVQGASSSTNNAASNNCGRVRPGTSSGVDRPRMRGNRGDDDFALADAKPRNFLNKLLVQYTQAVDLPPDETCSICMWSLQESSGYSDDENEGAGNGMHLGGAMRYRVVSLILCGHLFHQACIREMAKSSPHFLECPNCKTLHGEKLGNQPDGKMSVIIVQRSLPGHSDCNTIQITYNIQSGIQGPEHPHPGLPYKAIGFPRTAYLPNNAKGKKVLSLLREAWQRRLIFTVGTSVTTGTQDAVTWNEIHHKTEWNNNTGHGYPDPNYLDNILRELAAHGVTETTLV